MQGRGEICILKNINFKMASEVSKWFRISLLNLSIVAFIGVLLRYKIAFSLPYLDQHYLLHGHSHFAFAGWITQALMTLMVSYLFVSGQTDAFKKYRTLLILNLLTAYGMVISFPIQGYGFFSIVLSTLSIFVSYGFAVIFWKDLNQLKDQKISKWWFKGSLIFSVISSVGPFSLSYMMATDNLHEKWYLASIYFFLHFQYNGWFFFACMGLLVHRLELMGIYSEKFKSSFIYFFAACIPAYFLSVLWIPIHTVVYIIVILSALAQFYGWILFLKALRMHKESLKSGLEKISRILMIAAGIALTIKLILQVGSTHPQLSQIAFGFRPIIIGYLHLVLLGMITLFIIGYAISQKIITMTRFARIGIIIFVVGVIINELILMLQGVQAMQNESIPSVHYYLFGIALVMFMGIVTLVTTQYSKRLREGM